MTGEPLPQFSADPVVDFCVKEAVANIAAEARDEAQRAAEKARKVQEFKDGAKTELPAG